MVSPEVLELHLRLPDRVSSTACHPALESSPTGWAVSPAPKCALWRASALGALEEPSPDSVSGTRRTGTHSLRAVSGQELREKYWSPQYSGCASLTTPSRQFARPNHGIERSEELRETQTHRCQHRSQHFKRYSALAPLKPADVGGVDAYSKGKSFLRAEASLQAELLDTSANLGSQGSVRVSSHRPQPCTPCIEVAIA